MTDYRHSIKVKFLLLGIIVGFGVFLLLGARSQDDVVLLASDRYRVSAWGDPHSHGAFVVDSLTGKTKLVYRHYYGTPENGLTPGDSMEDVEQEDSELGEGASHEQNHLGLSYTKIP